MSTSHTCQQVLPSMCISHDMHVKRVMPHMWMSQSRIWTHLRGWLKSQRTVEHCDFSVCVCVGSVRQCVVVCYRAMQCVAVCCRVLQCVAVHCSVFQRVAVCCRVLQTTHQYRLGRLKSHCTVEHCHFLPNASLIFRSIFGPVYGNTCVHM